MTTVRVNVLILWALLLCVAVALCMPSCTSCGHRPARGHGDEARFAQLDSVIGRVTSADSLAAMMKHYHAQGDAMGEMIASKYYGRERRTQSRFTDAITAHNRSLDIATQVEDTIEMVEALNELGTDCRRQGD